MDVPADVDADVEATSDDEDDAETAASPPVDRRDDAGGVPRRGA
jgi:hypothetical protein